MTGQAIDIRPQDLEIVRAILRDGSPPDAKVWVFGSRAKWTTKDSSDLDLAIDAGRKLSLAELSALNSAFEDSDLAYKVDLLDWTTASQTFKEIVERDRVELLFINQCKTEALNLQKCTIGDLCDAGLVFLQTGPFGSQLHTYDYVSDGTPVVPTEAIRDRKIDHSVLPKISSLKADELGRHRLQVGDILFARRGAQATGHVAYVRKAEEGFICGTGAILLRVKPGNKQVLSEYLSHVFANPVSVEWFKFHAIGATMPNLNEGIIRSFPLAIPPLSEQRLISSLLSALDDKIELNRRMNETLEAMAQAIFKDWFIAFGPTRAKAEGRAPYLAPEIWSLFPDRFGDSGKPDGWNAEPVYDQALWVNGAAYKDMHFSSESDALPVVKIVELKNGITKTTRFTNTDLGGRYKIGDGELLFSWSGNPDTSIDTFVWTSGAAWLNQHIFAVRPNGKHSQAFLYAMLKSLRSEFAEIARNKQTTGLGHVTQKDLMRLEITVPDPGVLAGFDEIVAPLHGRFTNNLFECQSLAQTRDLLLPRLMSGEILVRDAEKAVEAVL